MRIQWKTSPRGDYREIEIEKGTSVEELYRNMTTEQSYTVLAARIQNRLEELTYTIEEPCKVELLDMRTQDANLIYQYSLTLLYIKAVTDCLGPVRVEVQNSLNKGLYTEIKTKEKESLTELQIQQIEDRMKELVTLDLPFVKETVSREEAIKILREEGLEEKCRLIEGYKEEDFFLVIDKKYKEWKDSEMEKFLRPETLFSNKFESYYNQPEIMKQRTLKDISMAEIDEALKREKQQMGDKANNDTVGIY